MFIVKKVMSRGLFRDKVLVEATVRASQDRPRLGWDLLGAPDVRLQSMTVEKGGQYIVSLPRRSVTSGNVISAEQAAHLPGFKKIWRRVPSR